MFKKILLLLIVLYSSYSFSSCDLRKRVLRDCNFSNRNFERYNFSNKELSNINFKESNLFGAVFNKTILSNVDFTKANLFGAFFVGTFLDSVIFTGSDISSADFTGASVNLTSFVEAIKDDTIFGAMKSEKPDIIKAKSCKLIVDSVHKEDWSMFVLRLSIKGAGASDKFVVNSLCKWHPEGVFILHGASLSSEKEILSINYNSCTFSVLVWVDETSNKVYIEDKYRSACLKESHFSSCNYLSGNRDMNMCKGASGQVGYCGYLSSSRDINMCKGMSVDTSYCSYLADNRDINMCKGVSENIEYCGYLADNRDMNMCKGMSGKIEYCGYLSSTRDINLCKGIAGY